MKHVSNLMRWAEILAIGAIVISCSGAVGSEPPGREPARLRPDVIRIDTLGMFGKLERPPVVFLHDRHTDALERKKKDCLACHLPDKEYLSPKFKRLEDAGRRKIMDIYHADCIDCHNAFAAAGENTGPIVCGGCHKEEPAFASNRTPMELDLSLHYRHSKALENKCEKCHHAYDEKAKKLFYDKGKEGTCRYCHEERTVDNRISMRLASHLSCIDCHREMAAAEKKTGPVHCKACHDPNAFRTIEKVRPVPRIERKQPDTTIINIQPVKSVSGTPIEARMNPVPFDHKAHEAYNDTCRVCHHASMQACADCHTLGGSKEGRNVNLWQAMHRRDKEASCLGCHDKRKDRPSCAGCHTFRGTVKEEEASFCRRCHMDFPPEAQKAASREKAETSAMLLQARKPVTGTFLAADIPEKVIMKELADKYEPVELPHLKIVRTLLRDVRENKLVQYFHGDPGTLCQGCHHNTPPDKKPPRCSHCHGKPEREENLVMPGLKAAYHRQCMECHFEMGIDKPAAVDCVACHKERK